MTTDPDEQRAASRETWEHAAGGWEARAERVREWGMPVSLAMVESLSLHPGQHVVELAAGPGDTGFLAAELIAPGGTLTSSDGAEAMVAVARRRAARLGITNVEFMQLELEWIDLPTATVDAVLCRWGIMLIVDPAAAAQEIRRVLRPGGRAAFAVWDRPEANPWATIPSRVLIELGHLPPPDPAAPGMFALAGDGRLERLLGDAGFLEVEVIPVAVERRYDAVEEFVQETIDMSSMFRGAFAGLDAGRQAEIRERMAAAAGAFATADGTIALPGCSLVASAGA